MISARLVDKGVAEMSFAGPEKILEKLRLMNVTGVELVENEAAVRFRRWVNSSRRMSSTYGSEQSGRCYCSFCGWNAEHTDGGCLPMQILAIQQPGQVGFNCQYIKKS